MKSSVSMVLSDLLELFRESHIVFCGHSYNCCVLARSLYGFLHCCEVALSSIQCWFSDLYGYRSSAKLSSRCGQVCATTSSRPFLFFFLSSSSFFVLHSTWVHSFDWQEKLCLRLMFRMEAQNNVRWETFSELMRRGKYYCDIAAICSMLKSLDWLISTYLIAIGRDSIDRACRESYWGR